MGPSPQLGSWWRNYRWTDWLGRTQDGQYDPEPKFGGKRRVRAPEQVVLELPFCQIGKTHGSGRTQFPVLQTEGMKCFGLNAFSLTPLSFHLPTSAR